MTDMDITEEEDPSEQIRVSFVLAAGVNDASLRVPSEAIAVPGTVRRKGLSAVVNHLLDRQVGDDDDDDDNDDDKLPAVPFDFLIHNRLLRVSVEAAVRREGLSFEQAVEIRYFPALTAPSGRGSSETQPDWISAMSYSQGVLCTASYDGSVRLFAHDGGGTTTDSVRETASVQAHTGPVKCLSSGSSGRGLATVVATGSMDQTLLTHLYSDDALELQAVYSGGHSSSVESVALYESNNNNNNGTIMASGDWNGGLCLWKVPEVVTTTTTTAGQHKRRKTDHTTTAAAVVSATTEVEEVRPTASWKAHAGSVAALSWGFHDEHRLLSTSWDHSLKVWDVTREDCLLTLNGSRVISAMGRCSNSDVVATGHPDRSVRLWDLRTDHSKGSGGDHGTSSSDGSLKPSHKAWVSALQWSPTQPHVLATNSHDGCVKMWDIRSSLPLHTLRAHKQGTKGLCLAFADDDGSDDTNKNSKQGGTAALFSGGSDCKVQKFTLG